MPISDYYKPLTPYLKPEDEEQMIGPQLPKEQYPWVDGPDISARYEATPPGQSQAPEEDDPGDYTEADVGPRPLMGPQRPAPMGPPKSDLDRIREILQRNQMQAAELSQQNALNQRDIDSQRNYNAILGSIDRGASMLGNFQGKPTESALAPTLKQLDANLVDESKNLDKQTAAQQAMIARGGENEFELLKGRGTELGNQAKELEFASNQQRSDPNSAYSIGLRAFVNSTLKPQVLLSEGISAEQIEKVLPQIKDIYLNAEAQQFKSQESAKERASDESRFKRKLAFDREALNTKSDIAQTRMQNGPKLSGSQYLAATYANRLDQAEETFDKLAASGFNRSDAKYSIQSKLPDFLAGQKDSRLIEQEQAERNFINAVLRRESGAVISPTEFASAEKQYLPRYGDTPEVIAEKRRNRQIVMGGLKAESGGAFDKVQNQIATDTGSGPSVGKGLDRLVIPKGGKVPE